MIVISRADLRRFRTVARRCAPSGRPRGPSPPARVSARGGTVTLAAHLGDGVVALRSPAAQPGSGLVDRPGGSSGGAAAAYPAL